jgi:hypothetical protein
MNRGTREGAPILALSIPIFLAAGKSRAPKGFIQPGKGGFRAGRPRWDGSLFSMRDLLKNFRFMIRDFPIKIELVLPAFPARSSGRRKIISPLPLGDEAFPKKSG